MTALHIVQGGHSNGDKEWIEKAALEGLDARKWVVPKNAIIGDDVVIYVGSYGFFATASIKSLPKPRSDWPNRYGAALTKVKLIEPSISLAAILRHIPLLTWANYPRSITTPDSDVSTQIRNLIKDRRKSGLPDLDDEALSQANLDELRAVALMAEKSSVPANVRKTIFRVRSTAIHRYVLARASGHCEGCQIRAPFDKSDGSPYLEPHHTHQLSDEGPDHPAHVIALCPNCHRRAHHANDASRFNKTLIKALLKIEPNKTKKRSVK